MIRSTFAISFIALTLLSVAAAAAQTPDVNPTSEQSNHAIYYELLGNAPWSINYEYRPIRQAGIRIGFGYFTIWGPGDVLLPITVHGFPLWKGKHSFEVVGGVTTVIPLNEENTFFGITGTLGYRYQKQPRGWLFRIGLSPYWNVRERGLWPAISLGYGL